MGIKPQQSQRTNEINDLKNQREIKGLRETKLNSHSTAAVLRFTKIEIVSPSITWNKNVTFRQQCSSPTMKHPPTKAANLTQA